MEKKSESQLYEWLKWFDDNNFVIEAGPRPLDPRYSVELQKLLGKDMYAKMVRK